jgi:PAS domain S-box-containing protein
MAIEAPGQGRQAFEIAPSAFLTLDPSGRVLYANPRAESLFGYEPGEVEGLRFAERLIAEADRHLVEEALRSLTAGAHEHQVSWRLDVRALCSDGREVPVEMAATGVPEQRGRIIHAWINDPSERVELLRELEVQLRAGEPGMAQILDALAEAVTIRDPHDHIIYANKAAVRHMGFDSLQELQQRAPQAILDDYIVQDDAGNQVTMGDIPSVRLLAGQPRESLLLRTVHRVTGEIKWNLLKSTVIQDQDGVAVAAVTVIEDVTAGKTAEMRQRFLGQASETLMSSIDFQETLRNVAWLAVPEIADWCAVDLVDEMGIRQQVVVAHSDPSKLELVERIRAYGPRDVRSDRGVGRVIQSGVSELHSEISDEMLVAGAASEDHLELLRALGFRSALVVPLRARGRALGAMTLVTAESLRRLDQSDVKFAEELAGRAAVAVDNARLATARRDIAETLQRSLLPDAVPSIEGWIVATMYRPASASDEVEVGGDFYDFFETPKGWIVLLGDVTGRGVQAASMTSLVRHGARFLAKEEYSPSGILTGLNQALREQPALSLCSALCIRLEPGRVVMSSAGHPCPVLIEDAGAVREMGHPGPLLGGWDASSWNEESLEMSPAEMLLMYTDGVTEARGEHDRFGMSRLEAVLTKAAGASPAELLDQLMAALARYQVEGRSDDTGAVALRTTQR